MLKSEKDLKKIIFNMLNESKRKKNDNGEYIDDPNEEKSEFEKDDDGKYTKGKLKPISSTIPSGLPKTRRTLVSPKEPIKDAMKAAGMIVRTGPDDRYGKKIRKEDLLQTEKDLYDFLNTPEGQRFLIFRFGEKGDPYRDSTEEVIELLYTKPKSPVEEMIRTNKLSFLGQAANAFIVYRPDITKPSSRMHDEEDEDEEDSFDPDLDIDWSDSEDD
jgi:hypothetical protein